MILLTNSRLNWALVMSESDKTFSFMDTTIFDFTLVTVTVYWEGIRAWLPLLVHTDRILNTTVSCCVNETFRDSHL